MIVYMYIASMMELILVLRTPYYYSLIPKAYYSLPDTDNS